MATWRSTSAAPAYGAHALIHVGKHGNLEWLPGKGVGLSEQCWPDALLGPLPNIYPFIVNDPGEGAQAKRRTQAVIIDHLMPPLTRAETYGPLRNLELLADEYYEAQLLDPRRARELQRDILKLVRETHIDRELQLGEQLDSDADAALWLPRLDTYLCDLKESQIRDGLHLFGESPEGRLAHRHPAGPATHSPGRRQGRPCQPAAGPGQGFRPGLRPPGLCPVRALDRAPPARAATVERRAVAHRR